MSGVISVVLVAACLAVWNLLRQRRDVSPLLSVALFMYIVLWNAWPIVYSLTSADWSESLAGEVAYRRLVNLHLGLLVATLGAFLLLPSRLIAWPLTAFGLPTAPRTALRALVVGMAIFAVSTAYTVVTMGSGAEQFAFARTASASEAGRVGISQSVSGAMVALAVVALTRSWSQVGPRIGSIAWAIVGIAMVVGLTQGQRSVLLLPAILLLARNWQNARAHRPTRWMLFATVFGATVGAAPLLAIAIEGVRFKGRERIHLADVRLGYELRLAQRSPDDRLRLAARELNTKFDSYSTGVVLLDQEGSGSAGWRPYTSALLSPIPRLLLPSKPVPTSKNGEITGTPSSVAAQQFGNADAGMVVPVSPIAVVLWELGTRGLVLVFVMNVIGWVFCNSLLLSPSLFVRAVGALMLALPTAEVFAAPSSLVRDLLRYALYVVLIWTVTQVLSLSRVSVGSTSMRRSVTSIADRDHLSPSAGP